jgi:hypothetical protein
VLRSLRGGSSFSFLRTAIEDRMKIAFPPNAWQSATDGMRRLFVAAIGVATIGRALFRAPVWFETLNKSVVIVAIGVATVVFALAVGIAVRGSHGVVKRVAMEACLLACALIGVEAVLLGRAPERWSDDQQVQRLVSRHRAALERGIDYDARLAGEVVRDLQALGHDAVPGFAPDVLASPAVAAAIEDRGLVPLANVSNTHVVECNEGNGYLEFRSDEFGFNNPPGLAAGPVDVAVMGESLALGHCVPPGTSAVEVVRAAFPRTANFGVPGSRVLSQIGVFREYLEPLEPPVVVWFVNVGFAEPGLESGQPLLRNYATDAAFSQRLRERQADVDSFLRDFAVPEILRRDELQRAEIEKSATFPLVRMMRLGEVRRFAALAAVTTPPMEAMDLDLSYFERAVDRIVTAARAWDGAVILVILPSYASSMKQPRSMARYHAVLDAIDPSLVRVVDGVALFAAEPDAAGLFTLRMDNHPNERGHAVIGHAVVDAIESRSNP